MEIQPPGTPMTRIAEVQGEESAMARVALARGFVRAMGLEKEDVKSNQIELGDL